MAKNPTHFGKHAYKHEPRDSVTGGGVYAYLPFDNLDKDGKSIFKIGMTTNFHKRENNYHTSLPQGVWRAATLQNPTEKAYSGKTEEDLAAHYVKIEKKIFKDIRDYGGKVLSKNHRRKYNEGETEWIYTNEDNIEKAFNVAEDKYGGHLTIGTLNKLPKEKDATFVGKIYFY
jgi:T5orf172 domain